MRHCAAADCPHLRRHGRAAEYDDAVERCLDCAAPLAAGPAPPPELPAPSPPLSRALALRTAVSAAALTCAFALAFVAAPGGPPAADGPWWALPSTSLATVGLTPWLLAFAAVELAALALPPLRRRRQAGPRGRAPLRHAALLLGLGLALVEVTLHVGAARHLPGVEPRLLALGLLLPSVLLLALARAVERHGLGGGLPWLSLAVFLPRAIAHFGMIGDLEPTLRAEAWTGELLVAAAAIALPWLLASPPAALARRLPAGLALPLSGLTPLADLALPLALALPIAALLGFGLDVPEPLAAALTPGTTATLAATAAATALLSLVYAAPRRVAAVRRALSPHEAPPRVGLLRAQRDLRRGVAVTLIGVTLAHLLHAAGADLTHAPLPLLELALAAAAALDAADSWRARRSLGALVPAWELHHPYAVAPAIDALARRGIPAVAQGRRVRALVPLLGAWAPITLLVRPEQAPDATAFLMTRLGAGPSPSRIAVIDAFG